MRYLKLFEELDLSTYYNTSSEFRKKGYHDRADNLDNHLFGLYLDNFLKDVSTEELDSNKILLKKDKDIIGVYNGESLAFDSDLYDKLIEDLSSRVNDGIFSVARDFEPHFNKRISSFFKDGEEIDINYFRHFYDYLEWRGVINEELNHLTYVNTYNKFKKLGYDDRADNMMDHFVERFLEKEFSLLEIKDAENVITPFKILNFIDTTLDVDIIDETIGLLLGDGTLFIKEGYLRIVMSGVFNSVVNKYSYFGRESGYFIKYMKKEMVKRGFAVSSVMFVGSNTIDYFIESMWDKLNEELSLQTKFNTYDRFIQLGYTERADNIIKSVIGDIIDSYIEQLIIKKRGNSIVYLNKNKGIVALINSENLLILNKLYHEMRDMIEVKEDDEGRNIMYFDDILYDKFSKDVSFNRDGYNIKIVPAWHLIRDSGYKFLNEELDFSTYASASNKLRKLGYEDRADNMTDHYYDRLIDEYFKDIKYMTSIHIPIILTHYNTFDDLYYILYKDDKKKNVYGYFSFYHPNKIQLILRHSFYSPYEELALGGVNNGSYDEWIKKIKSKFLELNHKNGINDEVIHITVSKSLLYEDGIKELEDLVNSK